MCGIGENWVKNLGNLSENSYLRDADQLLENKERALILFIKNPVLGKVKTRLAQTIGPERALEAYLQMLAHTRAVAEAVDCHRALYYSDFADVEDDWPTNTFSKQIQAKGDLGEKMAQAFQDLFNQGYEKVLIIGSDCLDLRPRHLESAFRALSIDDFVVGPADDGGYYLLGMRTFEPSLFENKNWSTETVLSSTLEDIQRLDKTAYHLPQLSDVDVESDLVAALARIKK
jgi:uncharacterized protein